MKRNFYIGVVVLLTVVIVSGVYMYLNQPPEVDAARLELDPVLGAEDAPVTIYQFGAYGCYSCRAIHQSGLNEQIAELVENDYEGQVNFVFVNLPVITSNDPLSAEAAQCALDQGQDAFWSFHNGLYKLSNDVFAEMRENRDFVEYARTIGLNADDLGDCLQDNTHERTVDHHEQRANRLNVPGTAVFYVNDRQVQPNLEAILELIDETLSS